MTVVRIGLIADIHGNIPALDAVMADMERRGIERMMVLGDLVGKGPESAEVVDRIRCLNPVVVQGNWDEAIMHAEGEAWQWHRERLGAERLAYLAGLPYSHQFTLSGKQIRIYHASAKGLWHRVFASSERVERLAMFENTLLVGGPDLPDPDVIGYADIHTPFLQHLGSKTLFNTGSVGNPLDTPAASYCILEGDDSTGGEPLALQFVRLPYDLVEAVRRAEMAGMPELAEYRKEILTARYRNLKDV